MNGFFIIVLVRLIKPFSNSDTQTSSSFRISKDYPLEGLPGEEHQKYLIQLKAVLIAVGVAEVAVLKDDDSRLYYFMAALLHTLEIKRIQPRCCSTSRNEPEIHLHNHLAHVLSFERL